MRVHNGGGCSRHPLKSVNGELRIGSSSNSELQALNESIPFNKRSGPQKKKNNTTGGPPQVAGERRNQASLSIRRGNRSRRSVTD